MNDLEEVMWEAWGRVEPMLRSDPDELRARLARRRSVVFGRPMRAMCLAVRASDRRINLATAILTPEDAMDTSSEWHRGRVVEHEVVLDARLLRKLCAPVYIAPPGEPYDEVAERLGMKPSGLEWLRRNGTLRVHYVKGLGGRRGKPVPLVYTEEALDPCARGKGRPDPIWGALWTVRGESLADDFEATLVRVPVYGEHGGREQHQGWRWVCPGCKREVGTVFLPRRAPDWGKYVGFSPLRIGDCGLGNDPHPSPLPEGEGGRRAAQRAAADEGCVNDADGVPEPVECFACQRCHGVRGFTRADLKRSWNELVLHYSGGLMYGREVRRPGWLKEGRKRAYRKQSSRATPRQEQVKRLLLETGMTRKEMARELGVTYRSAWRLVRCVYRKHGVKDREGLRGLRIGDCGLTPFWIDLVADAPIAD